MKLHTKFKKIPLYPNRICVILSDSAKKVNKFLRSHGNTDEMCFKKYGALTIPAGRITKEGWYCTYLIFNPKEVTHGLIGHEIRHATNYTFEHIEHRLDACNDEPEAYLTEWLTDFVYQVFKKSGNLSKIKVT